MASSADPRLRQLRIKTGVLKRLDKEKQVYEKEAVDQQTKVEKMRSEAMDEHDIRKQEEVLEESKNMIPDCQRRLNAAHTDLQSLVESAEDLKAAEEYQAAKSQLDSVNM